MRSPQNMEIIQIDITNACPINCSNCTRFCGLHKKPFFMDFNTFKKAVDSLKNYSGIVGIMGGEPTLHPQFAEFMEYYREHIPDPRPRTIISFPTSSCKEYVQRAIYSRGRKRGLWSSFGPGYYKHFELIQEIFVYQVLNDHIHPNQHQAILISRKELGVSDDEWIKQRDKCWLQNLWSASITPKGAFYCEIAAALDMLFDGPGGWPIDSEWWKRTPEEFANQIHWCEMCSLALKVPSIPAEAKTDLISREMEAKLLEINGWKMRTKHYKIFDADGYNSSDRHDYKKTWFLPNGSESYRVSSTVSSLFPQKIDIAVLDGESSEATITSEQLHKLEFSDFIVVFSDAAHVDMTIIEQMKRCVLNPGFFYDLGDGIIIFNRRASALKSQTSITMDRMLPYLWDKAKRSRISQKKLGELTFMQNINQLWGRFVHRASFLYPMCLTKNVKP